MPPDLSNPTDVELSVLRVLWSRGPSSVREVYKALGSKKAYTTVLSIMQIMTEKGFIMPDKSQHAFVYSVTVPAQQVQNQLVTDLIDRAFGGAAGELVLHALATSRASKEDVRKIRVLLKEMESRR